MSKAAERIATRIEDLPEGSLRRRVLEGARRFKASWVELARLLSQVRREGTWREWGFPSFEHNCARELFIRRQTADELLLAFRFLEREEPGVLERKEERPLADFRSVDLLR